VPVNGSGHLFSVSTQGYSLGPLQRLSNLDAWPSRGLAELKKTR